MRHKFYEHDFPELVCQLARLNDNLERSAGTPKSLAQLRDLNKSRIQELRSASRRSQKARKP
jgi:hypothetical protein